MSDLDSENSWLGDLAHGTTGVKLVEVDHPLEIYVGADDAGRAKLQIRTGEQPKIPPLSELVVVDRMKTHDSWLLSLTLQDPRFNEVFVRLTSHLVDRSRVTKTEAAALDALSQVFDQWRRLLQPKPVGRLSLEALRGLVGELWFLLEVAAVARGTADAVEGWSGPLGSPQDFWYPDAGSSEIKAVGISARDIRISSAEQLDVEGMELVVIVVEQVSECTTSSVSLVDLVSRVSSKLNAEGADHDGLELRFRRLGVDLNDPFYADTSFVIENTSRYTVTEEFPAIRASQLPSEISHVQYTLARASLESFKSAHTTWA